MSGEIDLNTLPAPTLLHKLLHYIKSHADLKRTFHITIPEVLPSPQPQRGETCKLKALSDAIGHTAYKTNSATVPLYKEKKHLLSLRQLAKKHGSVQGEMYSIEMLRAVCFDAGFYSSIYQPINTDDYVRTLEHLVDKNVAPMVFFDADLGEQRCGLPYIGTGSNEHSAVVVAYYKNREDETHFIITQWGRFYDFDGMELALSACHSLKDKREEETFIKKCNLYTDTTMWTLKNKPINEGDVLLARPERTARAMSDTDTPLKGAIMVVTEPRPNYSAAAALGIFSLKNNTSSGDIIKLEPFRPG